MNARSSLATAGQYEDFTNDEFLLNTSSAARTAKESPREETVNLHMNNDRESPSGILERSLCSKSL